VVTVYASLENPDELVEELDARTRQIIE